MARPPGAALADAVETARTSYRQAGRERSRIPQEFPARHSSDFPSDIPSRLEAARDDVRRVAGWTEAWRSAFDALPDCLRSLEEIPELSEPVRDRAHTTEQLLGQPNVSLTADSLDRLADLAELAFTAEHRPERDWLVRPGLDRASGVLDQVASI